MTRFTLFDNIPDSIDLPICLLPKVVETALSTMKEMIAACVTSAETTQQLFFARAQAADCCCNCYVCRILPLSRQRRVKQFCLLHESGVATHFAVQHSAQCHLAENLAFDLGHHQ